ncbi:MAG: nuclear transport factor 2 family protein [Solirubrobacterales bacterium]
MSQKNVESSAYRQRLKCGEQPRRSLDERIATRFPAIATALTVRVSRLPPSSKVRQRVLARTVCRGFSALRRGDFEAALGNLYDPDVEWHGAVGGLDEGRVLRGRAEVVEAFRDYYDTWDRLELRPEEIIDTGDQLIVFVHEVARGRRSGIVVETDTAAISTLHEGSVVEVRNYLDRSEALQAAGLRK